jgi:hypothetical protein
MRFRREGERIIIPARPLVGTRIWQAMLIVIAASGALALPGGPFWPMMTIVLAGAFAISMTLVRAAESATRGLVEGASRSVHLLLGHRTIAGVEVDGRAISPIDPWSFELRHLIAHAGRVTAVHFLVFLKLPKQVVQLARFSGPDEAARFIVGLKRAIGVPPDRPSPVRIAQLAFPCLIMLAMVGLVLFGVALIMVLGFVVLGLLEKDPTLFWIGVPVALILMIYDLGVAIALRRGVRQAAIEHVKSEFGIDPT